MRKLGKAAIVFASVASGVLLLGKAEAEPVGYAIDGAPPLTASSSPPPVPPLACDWSPGDGTPTATTPAGAMRWGWVDLAAGYWQIVLGVSFPAGSHFRVDGQYPAARNFSWQLYNGQSQSLAYLPDFLIQADPGSRSPFNSINNVDTAIAPKGHYTLHIVFSPQPATPSPNTIYLDTSKVSIGSPPIFVYRVYNAFDGIDVAGHGGVPLPSVVEETPQGDVSLASLQTPLRCQAGFGARDGERRVVATLADDYFARPLRPNPIAATPVPAAPSFILFPSSGSTDYFVNLETRYLYVDFSQTAADLFLMRARAPSFATQSGGLTDPQLRHWSICQNSSSTYETYGCVQDQDAHVDAAGYFNVVVSVPAKKPPNATPDRGYDWLTYGTTNDGRLIFRYMLPSPNFIQSAFNVPNGGNPESVMGDYYPVTTYCANAVFTAHTQAGETPAHVFKACATGR